MKLLKEISAFDEVIRETDKDFGTSGLKKTSLIRIARLATVDQQLFIGSIGHVSDERLRAVKSRLSRWISESPRSI